MTLASMSRLVDDSSDTRDVVNVNVFVERGFLDVGLGSRINGSSAINSVDNEVIGAISEYWTYQQ